MSTKGERINRTDWMMLLISLLRDNEIDSVDRESYCQQLERNLIELMSELDFYTNLLIDMKQESLQYEAGVMDERRRIRDYVSKKSTEKHLTYRRYASWRQILMELVKELNERGVTTYG